MAIALVASIAQAQAASNPTTTGIDTTGANLLIGIVHYRAGSGGGTVADSKGATWNGLTLRVNSLNAGIRIYYATGSPTVGSAHTFSLTGDFSTIDFLAFSGAHATAPFDVENGSAADSSGATISVGSVTPNQANSLLVVGFTEGNTPGGGGPTIDSGFSTPVYTTFNSGTSARGGAVAYLIQGAAAAVNPTWTVSGVTEYATAIAAFKPSAGGGAFDPSGNAGWQPEFPDRVPRKGGMIASGTTRVNRISSLAYQDYQRRLRTGHLTPRELAHLRRAA